MLTVSDEVQLDSISLAFSEGESQDPINETLPYPQALTTKSATLDPSQTLKVPRAAFQPISGSMCGLDNSSLVASVKERRLTGVCSVFCFSLFWRHYKSLDERSATRRH